MASLSSQPLSLFSLPDIIPLETQPAQQQSPLHENLKLLDSQPDSQILINVPLPLPHSQPSTLNPPGLATAASQLPSTAPAAPAAPTAAATAAQLAPMAVPAGAMSAFVPTLGQGSLFTPTHVLTAPQLLSAAAAGGHAAQLIYIPAIPTSTVSMGLSTLQMDGKSAVHPSLQKEEHRNSKASRRGPMDEMRQL